MMSAFGGRVKNPKKRTSFSNGTVSQNYNNDFQNHFKTPNIPRQSKAVHRFIGDDYSKTENSDLCRNAISLSVYVSLNSWEIRNLN